MDNTKLAMGAGVVVLVLVGVYFLFLRPGKKAETTEENVKEVEVVEEKEEEKKEEEKKSEEEALESEKENVGIGETGEKVEEETTQTGVVVLELTGKNFEFSKKSLEVTEGDKVLVKFMSNEGFHDWTIAAFNAATAQVNEGETTSVEFVADQAGEFEYYCSVGNHRQMGMVGTLTVLPSTTPGL